MVRVAGIAARCRSHGLATKSAGELDSAAMALLAVEDVRFWHKADLVTLVGVSPKEAIRGNVSVTLIREVASLLALDIFPVSSRRECCR